MKILGMDTSSVTASCAVMREGVILGEAFCNAGLTHSQTGMPMVEFVLKQAKLSLREIDVFAVTTGPGSFTGLRIGLSQVKGMAQPGNTPCVGVSTLEALAWNVPLWKGLIVPCLDARRQQVYTGMFRWNGNNAPERLRTDEAMPLQELIQVLEQTCEPVLFLGDGAQLAYDYAVKEGQEAQYTLGWEEVRYVKGAGVLRCAMENYRQGAFVMPEALEPTYLRLPQVYQ